MGWRFTVLLSAILWCACSRQEQKAAGDTAPAGAGKSAVVLLNEILIQPAAGQPPFIELTNAGSEAANLDGVALVNVRKETWNLPTGITVAAGGVALIAPPAAFITGTTSLSLRRGNTTLDYVQWTEEGASPYVQTRGGYAARLPRGSVIARPPHSSRRGAETWTTFSPGEATPGAANRYPRVTGLMPMSGATLREAEQTLNWYTVVNATKYRVQLAQDRSFAKPLLDQTIAAAVRGVDSVSVKTPALSAGRYVWRVQALFDAGATSEFSVPALFWIDGGAPSTASRSWSIDLIPSAFAAETDAPMRKVLPVPFIPQRKDTRLLALEAQETGAQPWDGPWPGRTGPYCARASIAMVAAFFRGNVSQDRITYAAFKDLGPGPLYDIYVKTGFRSIDIYNGIKWALGVAPTNTFSETLTAATYYEQFRAEIDRGKPALATSAIHAWVVVGYGSDARGKYLVVNDPAIGQYDWLIIPNEGVEDADVQSPAVAATGEYAGRATETYFFPGSPRARSDEPEVQQDSDGDGVMDWDETTRFGTNPRAKDTDGDQVPDKEDIRAWVFDQDLGWSFLHPEVSPFDADADGKSMQVDDDSDGGGCTDGLEDLNHDGKHDEDKETWVIGDDDDPCLKGTYEFDTDITQTDNHTHSHHVATLSLLPQPDGSLKGQATETWQMIDNISYEPSSRCAYNEIHGQPMTFGTPLKGRVEKQPDGSVKIKIENNFDASTRPAYRYTWRSACQGGSSGELSYPVPFLPLPPEFTLVNGVYDFANTAPAGAGATGQTKVKIHLEQKKPETP